MPRNELTPTDLAAIIQGALRPLSEKVDDLLANRVTRSDMDKLRAEITTGYVSRDVYEARHSALIDRGLQMEAMIREERKERETDQQKLHDRLESGRQQLEERMKLQKEETEKEFKEARQAQLSAKDQAWLRISQVIGLVAGLIGLFELISQHYKP